MKQLFAVLAAIVFVVVLAQSEHMSGSPAISATAVPTAAYCAPPNTISPGSPVNSAPVQQNFKHAETCGGQYGDFYSDGPIFQPGPAYNDTTYAFSIPANVWVVNGQRIYTAAVNETAPSNQTSYWFLDSATGQYVVSSSSSPPTSTSVLEYTVTADGSGVRLIVCPPRTLLSTLGTNQPFYGAVCDGDSDNKALVNAAINGVNLPAYLPLGQGCFVSESFTALPDGRFTGPGFLITSESATPLPRAPDWTTIATPPPGWTASNSNFIGTAFNGDFSHPHLVWGTAVRGAATLTQPTTGYVQYPTTAGVYGYYFNQSGWNQDTADNNGRTATSAYSTYLVNNGQGDVSAYQCNSTVGGSGKSGATSFLANPNAGCYAATIQATSSGGYLNPYETVLQDGGNDVAAVGSVIRLNRTVNTGALGAIWQGVNIQSEGTQPIDSALLVSGPMVTGIDLTNMNFASPVPGSAAISFSANNCIYPNATNPGGPNGERFSRYTVNGTSSICYSSSDAAIEQTVGSSTAKLSALGLSVSGYLEAAGPVPTALPVGATLAPTALDAAGSQSYWYNLSDEGSTPIATHNIAYNNQGRRNVAITFWNDGLTESQSGGFTAVGIVTPAAPVLSCPSGGSNGIVTYFAKINMVGHATGQKSLSSPEATITCAANTELSVAAPTPLAGALTYTVSASLTTGTEAEQTQGTSPASGVQVPLSQSWTSTPTLSGATAASAFDASMQPWQQITQDTGTIMSLSPYVASYVEGPFECAKTPTSTSIPQRSICGGPIFTNTGGIVGTTWHSAEFSCQFSAGSSCALGASYWTGQSVFSSSTSIQSCKFSTAATDGVGFIFDQTATNTGTIYTIGLVTTSDLIKGTCEGT